MKDYTLSEVASVCISKQTLYNGTVLYDCKNCEFEQICSPTKWGSKVGEIIEPRDMIELPCKEHFTYTHDNGHITENWRVFYRSELALIETAFFPTETEADAFLAELKGSKQ